ncbi:MAG: pilus assembly protein [Methylobacteriaceae bacterium]|nr:pilus assembly protein [Methylobacteriaceae bacterium]
MPTRPFPALARFRQATDGVAAVEFALLAPVLVVLLLGLSVVTQRVMMDRKLTLLSRALADLTSRASSLASTDLSDTFAAASAIMQPYNSATVQMVVTSVLVSTDAQGNPRGTVDWSCRFVRSGASGTTPALTARAAGSNYAVPAGFTGAGSFMLVETKLPQPTTTVMFSGGDLGQTTTWPVRDTTNVTLSGGCPASPA